MRVITMYQCGPTVYDDAHIGHARSSILLDAYRRLLEKYADAMVVTAMNITDVDDKIIGKARERSKTISEIARWFEKRWFEDMDALGVQRPDIVMRVTDHIADIVAFIEILVSEKRAYARDGSVYFDSSAVDSPDPFGRGLVPTDFVVWKSASDDPSWESPWGRGRPGWHVECAVLSRVAFGRRLDLHGGGEDLALHHTNEMALVQPDFATTTFLHVGHMGIQGQKMSKSLKNFQTIREFVRKHGATCLRILVLLRPHWRKPFEFTEECVAEGRAIEKKIRAFVHGSYDERRTESLDDAASRLLETVATADDAVRKAVDRDVDIPAIMAEVLRVIGEASSYATERGEDFAVRRARAFACDVLGALGFVLDVDERVRDAHQKIRSAALSLFDIADAMRTSFVSS